MYAAYHKHFASWGYAVVTYGHATVIDLIPDSVEVNYSPPVLAWAAEKAGEAGTAGMCGRGGLRQRLNVCASIYERGGGGYGLQTTEGSQNGGGEKSSEKR